MLKQTEKSSVEILTSQVLPMLTAVTFLLNSVNTIWLALISDPIKTIGAFASIGALIISWKNLKKDATKISLVVERAQDGPLILQYPDQEFLVFKVHNQSATSIVVNEVGIVITERLTKKHFINLIDVPYADMRLKGKEDALGSIECVGLPGDIPARSMGVSLLNYSALREASINYRSRKIVPDNPNFFGSNRVIRIFQACEKLQDSKGLTLHIIPYAVTGSGERFIGSKSRILLGSLGHTVS